MYFGSLNYMLQYVVAFDLTPLVYSKTEAMVKTFEYIIFPIGCPGRIVKKSIAQGGVRFSGQQDGHRSSAKAFLVYTYREAHSHVKRV